MNGQVGKFCDKTLSRENAFKLVAVHSAEYADAGANAVSDVSHVQGQVGSDVEL